MSDDILDFNEFMERVQDDKDLLMELLDIFAEDYQEKIASLQKAVNNNNIEEIKSIAHSLKGASGNISAKRMRELFLSMEDTVKNSDMDGANKILEDLSKEYEALNSRINELKEEFKS